MGSDDETGAVSLVFDSERVWVAGETIQGEVELYFPALLHENVAEVHVKLRGSIRTYAALSVSSAVHSLTLALDRSRASLVNGPSLATETSA